MEVSYPADETSIEAVQQLCGNLFSAVLVPFAEKMASSSFHPFPAPMGGMRGDSVTLVALVASSVAVFSTFRAPLARSAFDSNDDDDEDEDASYDHARGLLLLPGGGGKEPKSPAPGPAPESPTRIRLKPNEPEGSGARS